MEHYFKNYFFSVLSIIKRRLTAIYFINPIMFSGVSLYWGGGRAEPINGEAIYGRGVGDAV
jgi:hypothetical protein